MTFKKRKGTNVYWADLAGPHGKRVRESLKTSDKVIAQERYLALQRRVMSRSFGVDVEPGEMTISDAFKTLLANRPRWVNSKAPETIRTNFNKVAAILGGDRQLSTIDDEVIDDLVVELRGQNAANSTVSAKLSILRVILAHGLERRVLQHVPLIPHFASGEGFIRWYSPEEEQTIVGAYRASALPAHQDMADFVIVLVDTGMRLSEALAVGPRDINLKAGSVTIWDNKASKPRTVPLTARVRQIVERRVEAAGKAIGARLFPSLTKDIVSHRWTYGRDAAGLLDDPQAVIHTLRHTCCSRLVQGGMDIRRVQIWMGHKVIQTTLLYAHLADDHLREGLSVLECAVSVTPPSETVPQIPTLKVVGSTTR